MSQEIDTKEVRGINLKLLIQLVIIVAATISCYFGVVSKIDNITIETKYKIEALETRINNNQNNSKQEAYSQQIQINDIKTELANKQNKR